MKTLRICLALILLSAVGLHSTHEAMSALQSDCSTLQANRFCIARVLGQGEVGDIAFSPSSDLFAFTSTTSGTQIYDTSGQLVLNLASLRGTGLEFTPDGSGLAVGAQGAVQIIQLSTGETNARYEGHNGTINTIDFSGSGEFVASGGRDGLLNIWNFETGELVASESVFIDEFGNGINEALFISDDQIAVSGNFGVRIYNISTEGRLSISRSLNSGLFIRGLALSPNKQFLATSGSGSDVIVWDTEHFRKRHAWEIVAETGQERGAYSVEFTGDSRELIIGEIHTHSAINAGLQTWNLSTGDFVRRINGTMAHVEHLTRSPNGQYMVSFMTTPSIYVVLWRLR